jgi:hypothetical protein
MTTLQIRRGTSFTDPKIGEPFFNTTSNTLQVGSGDGNIVTLTAVGSSFSGFPFTGSAEISGSLTVTGDTTITENVVIQGNLDVQGTSTTINTTTLSLNDNIIELNGVNASNGGILVKDVTGGNIISGSLLWDGTNDYWKAGQLGSESEIVTVSSFSSNLPNGLVSGSEQIDYTSIQNKPTTITSEQASAITTNTSKVGYTDAAVKTKLDAEGVISSSAQVELPSGVVSGSIQVEYTQITNIPTLLELGTTSTTALAGDTTTITSEQASAISTNTSKVGYTDSLVKTKLDAEGVLSGSVQVELPSGTVSGSSQIEYTQITNIPTLLTLGTSSTTALRGDTTTITSEQASSITTNTSKVGYTDAAVKTKLDAEGVLSGSTQVELPSGVISGSVQVEYSEITNIPTTITSEQVSAISTNTSKVGYTDSLVKTKLDVEGVISGSSPQLLSTSNSLTLSTNTLTLTKGDGTTDTVDLSVYLDNDSRAIASGTLNSVNGVVTFTRDDSTTFTLDLSDLLDDTNLVTSVNGSNGVVVLDTDDINQGTTNLYYTDTAVKTKLDAEGVISSSAQVELPSGVVSGSSQVEYSEITNIPTLLTLGTTSTTALAGDTTTITTSQANAIATNTSKVGYEDSLVKTKLDTEGVISSSAQISSFGFTSETTEIPAGTVSGSSQVDYTGLQNLPTLLTLGTTSTTALAGDTTTITSEQASAITTNTSKVGYTDAAVKTKLDAEGVVSGSGQIDITGNLPSGVVSGSTQVDYTGLQNLPTLLVLGTSSTTALAGDTTTITSEQATAISTNTSKVGYTDEAVKTKLDSEGVISGSSQVDVTGALPSGTVSGSSQIEYSEITNIPTTITSEQATAISTNTSKVGYTDSLVKTKLDTENVVSGSVDDFVKFINSNEVGFSGSLIMEDDTNNIMIGTGSYANYPGTLNIGLGIKPFDADDMGALSGGDKASGNISIGIGNFRGLNTSGHMRGSYNIGMGVGCFTYLQGGDYNIGIGHGALTNLQSSYGGTSYGYSNDNTAVGYFAGRYAYTGNNNTFIGNEAGPSSATANINNAIYLGNSSITSLKCNVQTISSLSDKRDKTNIETLPVGLDFINELKPVSFDWDRRDGTFKDKKDTGFIAQELDEVQVKYNVEDYLELVSKDDPDRLEASYGKLIPVLVKAIQELSEEVSSLKSELGK